MLHGNIVSRASLKEMTLNIPLTNGWSPGLKYGLGLMQVRRRAARCGVVCGAVQCGVVRGVVRLGWVRLRWFSWLHAPNPPTQPPTHPPTHPPDHPTTPCSHPQTSLPSSMDHHNQTWIIGHGGCDYGSIALSSGINLRYNFSMSIASNSVGGMNCSAAYRRTHPTAGVGGMYNQAYYTEAVCHITDAVIQAVNPDGKQPRLTCPAMDDGHSSASASAAGASRPPSASASSAGSGSGSEAGSGSSGDRGEAGFHRDLGIGEEGQQVGAGGGATNYTCAFEF
jgi:hypothetical protein